MARHMVEQVDFDVSHFLSQCCVVYDNYMDRTGKALHHEVYEMLGIKGIGLSLTSLPTDTMTRHAIGLQARELGQSDFGTWLKMRFDYDEAHALVPFIYAYKPDNITYYVDTFKSAVAHLISFNNAKDCKVRPFSSFQNLIDRAPERSKVCMFASGYVGIMRELAKKDIELDKWFVAPFAIEYFGNSLVLGSDEASVIKIVGRTEQSWSIDELIDAEGRFNFVPVTLAMLEIIKNG